MENQQGISLLEVLLALLLLSISGVAMLRQQISLNIAFGELIQRNQALLLVVNGCQSAQMHGSIAPLPPSFNLQRRPKGLSLYHAGRNQQTFTLEYPCPLE